MEAREVFLAAILKNFSRQAAILDCKANPSDEKNLTPFVTICLEAIHYKKSFALGSPGL